MPASTSSIGRPPETNRADLLERPLGRREPDPLDPVLDEPLEPLDREREMDTALGAGDRVHLVEDQRLDAPQRSRGRPT